MPKSFEFPMSRRLILGAAAAFGVTAITGSALALAKGFAPYSKEAFETALKGAKPVLVHVHADWCPVCVRQEQVFNELSTTADFAKFTAFTVDFDMDTDFRKTYGVAVQSVILVFKGGKEVARSGGVTDKDRIATFIGAAAR